MHDIDNIMTKYNKLKMKYPNIAEDMMMMFFDKMEDVANETLDKYKYKKENGHHINSEEMYKKAVSLLVNADGSIGPHWSLPAIKEKSGINFETKDYTVYDYAYVVNMFYSDYGEVFKNLPPKEFCHVFLKMAKLYLSDEDYFGDPSERAYHNAMKRIEYNK